jgi:5-formyltetrahydrofolate cyclo-ligase
MDYTSGTKENVLAVDDEPSSKEQARALGYAVRAAMTMHEQALLDAKIFHHVQENWDWNEIERVHVYLPLARRREIGTWALVRWLWAAHPDIKVYVPRMLNDGGLEHIEVNHDTRFRPNHYEIPEPMVGHLLQPDEPLDMVITPLLAYDLEGNRVGYGAGYYDRFLSEHPKALRVGLAYGDCLVKGGIKAEKHDIPLQVIVTEHGITTIGAEAAR